MQFSSRKINQNSSLSHRWQYDQESHCGAEEAGEHRGVLNSLGQPRRKISFMLKNPVNI
jgi:hypothetical protein